MGLFKQAKDMKNLIGAAPEMLSAAQQMGAQAQEMAAAQQAAVQQAMAPPPPAAAPAPVAATGDFAPIGTVSLELYVEISKVLTTNGYDQAQAPGIAAGKGVSAADWALAVDGWNARMRTVPAVAQRFNALYTAA